MLNLIKAALQAHCADVGAVKGYFTEWQANLLERSFAEQVEGDLRSGSGQELHTKFRALHSSSALAVNTFAPFRLHPDRLTFLGKSGFEHLQFEKRLPTGLRGIPPNLDVWLQGDHEVIAIESKFLEYFTPRLASFSGSYVRSALSQSDDAWWSALEASKQSPKQYLDVAQLVKHALGLLQYRSNHSRIPATLVYLFWEPVDAAAIDGCCQHRRQIQGLARCVEGSGVRFHALSYGELWAQWNKLPAMATHLQQLRARYEFAVG